MVSEEGWSEPKRARPRAVDLAAKGPWNRTEGHPANPRALAEIAAGGTVPWERLGDPDGHARRLLGGGDLFDRDSSPLWNVDVPALLRRAPGPRPRPSARRGDLYSRDRMPPVYLTGRAFSGDPPGELLARLGLDGFGWDELRPMEREAILLGLGVPVDAIQNAEERLDAFTDDARGWRGGAEPGEPRVTWVRKGRYLTGEPSVLDPVQGIHGNGHMVAALSALAWTWPEVIGENGGLPPGSTGEFLALCLAVPGRSPDYPELRPGRRDIYIPRRLPVLSESFGWLFARGPSGTWPGAYEVAVAQLTERAERGGRRVLPRIFNAPFGPGWHPLTLIAGGKPVAWRASAAGCAARLASMVHHDEWPGRAFAPMVASAREDLGGLRATDEATGVVAGHAYAVLGTLERDGEAMVILRNPWGCYPPGNASGEWHGLMLRAHGVGALDFDAFRDLFDVVVGTVR